MAVKKDVTINRIDGAYIKLSAFRFHSAGMCEVDIQVWKNENDRKENPTTPLVASGVFFITDKEKRDAIHAKLYELFELIPELAGGERIDDQEEEA